MLTAVGAWAQVNVPFTTSDAPSNGVWAKNTKWYFISFPHSDDHHTGGYLAAEGAGFISAYGYDGKDNARTSKGKLLITQTEKPIKPSALWCVVGNETDGYTFYNKMNPYLRLGMTSELDAARLYGTTDIEGVTYKFKANAATNSSYSSREDCCTLYTGTNSYWNDKNESGKPDCLACWTHGDAQAAGGSVVCFTAVTEDELQQMAEAVTVPVSSETDVKKTYFRIKNLRSLKYAMYNGDATRLTQTDDVASIRTLWYVTADDDGYHFYNAASSKKYASLNSFTDEGTKMYIKENPYCTGLFCISTNSDLSGNCWDDNQNGGFSDGWNPRATDYAGTSWYMEKVNTDNISTEEIKEELSSQITALQSKYANVTVGQRELTEAGKAFLDAAISAAQQEMGKENLDRDALLGQIRTLNAKDAEIITNADYSKMKAPAAGKFYRLKCAANNKYMMDENGTPKMVGGVSSGENRNTTVFYLDENNSLLSFSLGRYLDCYNKNFAVIGTKYDGEFGYAHGGPTSGVVTYKNNGVWTFGNGANGTLDRGSGVPDSPGYNWIFEEVSWLPVPVNTDIKYATMYSPVRLESSGRVDVYTATVGGNGTYVTLKGVDYIPAKVGVILQLKDNATITNGCVFLQILQELSDKPETDLEGTFAATNITGDGYVLSKPADGELGLYKALTVGNTWLNNAFKAYLPASVLTTNTGARFLSFDFGTETDIKTVESTIEPANAVIYDLSGRRVRTAQKGMYIVNGKKVIK